MFILGKKLNMTQKFLSDGTKVAVTALEVGPCKVVQVKSTEKEGYTAVQVGFGKKRKLTRAAAGHQKGNSYAFLREFHIPADATFKVGDEIKASDLNPGEYVDVSGIMKGRGFAGVMKRHGFHGFPASHGHDHPRSPGSIGSMFPQHTTKGRRMAGRMGGHQVTSKNLLVVDVEPDKNLIWVTGSVPGATGGLVKITATGEKVDAPGLQSYQKKEEVKAEVQTEKEQPKEPVAEEKEDEKKGKTEEKSERQEKPVEQADKKPDSGDGKSK